MMDQNPKLMPALLVASLLALAGAATAQGIVEDATGAQTASEPSASVELFSITDAYSAFVVDTCVEQHGASSPSLTAEGLSYLGDDSMWLVAEEGEVVVVEGYTTAASPTVLYLENFGAFVDVGDPCCLCGTEGSSPMGCKAYGKVCCCKADISLSLDEIHCYCQGGKGCDI